MFCLSTGNSIVQQRCNSKLHNEPKFCFIRRKVFAILLSGNIVVNTSLLSEVELKKYLDITTSKAQTISAFVTCCLLVHMLIAVCVEDNASLESPASLLNKVKALDEGSVCLK